jgi:hypothetical protein
MAANVVVTTRRYQNVVEVPQADGAVVFEHFSLFDCAVVPAAGVLDPVRDVLLLVLGSYPHLVMRLQYFDRDLLLNFVQDLLLLPDSLALTTEPPSPLRFAIT